MEKLLNCSCICKEDVAVAVVKINDPKIWEIVLIVSIVIAIVLILIIGFNKLKGEPEEDTEGQSYY